MQCCTSSILKEATGIDLYGEIVSNIEDEKVIREYYDFLEDNKERLINDWGKKCYDREVEKKYNQHLKKSMDESCYDALEGIKDTEHGKNYLENASKEQIAKYESKKHYYKVSSRNQLGLLSTLHLKYIYELRMDASSDLRKEAYRELTRRKAL